MNKQLSFLAPALLSAALVTASALPAQVRMRKSRSDSSSEASQKRNQDQAKKLEAQIRDMKRKIAELKRQEAQRTRGDAPRRSAAGQGRRKAAETKQSTPPTRMRSGGGMGGMRMGGGMSEEDMRKMQEGVQRWMQSGEMDENMKKGIEEMRKRFGGMGAGQGSRGGMRAFGTGSDRPSATGTKRRAAPQAKREAKRPARTRLRATEQRATDRSPSTDRKVEREVRLFRSGDRRSSGGMSFGRPQGKSDRKGGSEDLLGNEMREQIQKRIQQFMQQNMQGGGNFDRRGQGGERISQLIQQFMQQGMQRGGSRTWGRQGRGQGGEMISQLIQRFVQGMRNRSSNSGFGGFRSQGNRWRGGRSWGRQGNRNSNRWGSQGNRRSAGGRMGRSQAKGRGGYRGRRVGGQMMRGRMMRGGQKKGPQGGHTCPTCGNTISGGGRAVRTTVTRGNRSSTARRAMPGQHVMTWTQKGSQTPPQIMMLKKGQSGVYRINKVQAMPIQVRKIQNFQKAQKVQLRKKVSSTGRKMQLRKKVSSKGQKMQLRKKASSKGQKKRMYSGQRRRMSL